MDEAMFALFIDVMGVQRSITRDDVPPEIAMKECHDIFEHFHRDLADTLQLIFLVPAKFGGLSAPVFVAQFSDSAYVVGSAFDAIAIVGINMMRRALRHEYPLRGGIGYGSFSHEESGARTTGFGQVWSTSSFFGSAVVTAYHAERTITPGLRVFVHRKAAAAAGASILTMATSASAAVEETVTHELRIWRAIETAPAIERLNLFRDKQRLEDRERRHYNATEAAYATFASTDADIPFATPALWLF